MIAEFAAINCLRKPVCTDVLELTGAILLVEEAFIALQLLYLLELSGKLVPLLRQLLDDLDELVSRLLGASDLLTLELLHGAVSAAKLAETDLDVELGFGGSQPVFVSLIAAVLDEEDLVGELPEVDPAGRNVGLVLDEAEAGVDDGGHLSGVVDVWHEAELLRTRVLNGFPDWPIDVAQFASLGQDELVGSSLTDDPVLLH